MFFRVVVCNVCVEMCCNVLNNGVLTICLKNQNVPQNLSHMSNLFDGRKQR